MRPAGGGGRFARGARALLAGGATTLLAAGAVALLAAGGCQRSPGGSGEPGERPALLEIPRPDVSGGDPRVGEQIASRLAEIEELARGDDPAALADAYGDLGLVFITYDFLDAAETSFENSHRLAPGDFRWSYFLGYLDLIQGSLPEAVARLETVVEMEPEFLPARLRLARARLEQGELDAAEEQFERALRQEPSSAAALEGLGKVSLARQDYRPAIDYFTRALAAAPDATSLNYMLGQAYRQVGEMERAAAYLESTGDATVRIADPLINPLSQLGESAQFYLIQGGEALSDQNYETAVAAYARAVEQDPASFVAYKGLGYSLEKLGDPRGAVDNLETALAQATTGDPAKDRQERAEVHRILGGLKALEAHDLEAIGHFRESLRLAPDQPDVMLKLANALARSGLFEEALGFYDRTIEASPEHAAGILEKRATALVNLGRWEAALADFRQAVERDPDSPRLRMRFAEALEHRGDRAAAAEQRRLASAAVGEDTERAGLLAGTAAGLISRGELAEAIDVLTKALELAPDRSDLRLQRATLLAHFKRYDEALADFRRTVEEAPRLAAARRGEIATLILLGRYGEARMALQPALRMFSMDSQLAHVQARLLATAPDPRVRDGRLALEVAKRLDEAVGGTGIRETLAMAYAEAGDLAQAVALQRELVAEAERGGEAGLAVELRSRLAVFESGKAWAAESPEEILDATLGDS